jgi:hypothetical protein
VPESVFTSQVPASDNLTDSTLYTLATVIRPAVNGMATGVRFYAPQNTSGGTFTGVIYSMSSGSSGSELGRKAFSGLVGGAWNVAVLDTPVPLSAGQYYAVGYITPDYYVASPTVFTSAGITNGNLTAIQAGSPYGNGRLHVGDGFPEVSSANQANYFGDVVFEASPPSTWTYGFDVRIG